MTRAREGRQRVLEAAARVFQQDGYQTTTMARVAEAAGVSKGLPYHYFAGKGELARAVVADHLDEIIQVLSTWPEGSPEARLRWLLEKALSHAKRNQSSYGLYLSLALQPSTRQMVMEEVGRRSVELEGLEGEIRAIFTALGSADPTTEAVVLRATVDGLIQHLLMAPEQFAVEEAVERVLSLHAGRSLRPC